MATLKQRMWRKNNAGTYDTIHLETESSLVLRPSGRTVEQDLADFLPEVQATDDVPETLSAGKVKTTTKRPYVGVNGVVEGLILESDHPLGYEEGGELPPYEGIDADTLGGHTADDFVLDTELTTALAGKADVNHNHDGVYAPATHTHTTAQVTGLDTALAGKANSSHTHPASQISAGTLNGSVVANASAVSNIGTKQVRNIYAGTSDIGVGASLPTGDIYLVYG